LEDGEGDESIVVKMYLRDVGWKDAKWMELAQGRVELWTSRLAVFTLMLMLLRSVTDEEINYYLK
jgi:hypothetical protein